MQKETMHNTDITASLGSESPSFQIEQPFTLPLNF